MRRVRPVATAAVARVLAPPSSRRTTRLVGGRPPQGRLFQPGPGESYNGLGDVLDVLLENPFGRLLVMWKRNLWLRVTGPTILVSLILLVLCAAVAFYLYREQTDSA